VLQQLLNEGGFALLMLFRCGRCFDASTMRWYEGEFAMAGGVSSGGISRR